MSHRTFNAIASSCFVLSTAAFAQFTNPTVSGQPASAAPEARSAALLTITGALGEKKPGIVRIGIVEPKSNIGVQGSLTAGEPFRTAEAQLLASPKIEVVKLTALLPAPAVEEAKGLNCDYVLTSTVTQKVARAGLGGIGALRALSALPGPMSALPKVGALAGAVTMSAAQQAAMSAMTMATRGVKAKSEVTYEFSLDTVTGQNVLQDAQKAKPQSDGEDVVTPMIEQAVVRILGVIAK